MTINLSALQKQRRDSAANWTAENPTLLAGEIGIESDTGYWKVGDGSTAWTSLAYVSGLGAEIPVDRLADGAARQLLQTDAAGTGVEWTDNVDVPGTLDVTGTGTFDGNVTIAGDLTVNGTTTTINTQDLLVEDKNIIIGNVTTPSDVTADGGGITLKGTTDKTINWVDATDAWTLSEHVNIASGKEYRINGTKVLDATSLGSGVLITSANITDGTIVDADVNASAAIAGTKISPDFGAQNVTTTGTSTAASFTPTSSTVPTNGVYLPAANSVALSTNGSGRLFVDASGNVGINTASTIAPGGFGYARQFALTGATSGDSSAAINIRGSRTVSGGFGDINFWHQSTSNRAYIQARRGSSDSAIDLDFITSGGAGMRITSAGLVGIGVSTFSTQAKAEIATSGTGERFYIQGNTNSSNAYLYIDAPANRRKALVFRSGGSDRACIGVGDSDELTESTLFLSANANSGGTSPHMVINSSGNVGIGTTSPGYDLTVSKVAAGVTTFALESASGSASKIQFRRALTDRWSIGCGSDDAITFTQDYLSSERARIDSSGRLLVGTSSTSSNNVLVVAGTTNGNPGFIHLQTKATTPGSTDQIGGLNLGTAADTITARIMCLRDGGTWTPGVSTPTAVTFSTTADGASSPTERMRIGSNGTVLIGKTTAGIGNAGIELDAAAQDAMFTTFGATPVFVNRLATDGVLIDLQQASTTEGTISVSGTTVSYNGAHLSRWSQLVGIDPYDKTARPEILRGTVMSNLDEMCDWTCPTSGDCQDNEQLNKTKISDVEGDKNVAGVFQSWDDDDDTWVNDFYLAMTGDFVIRIAAGTTVQRGDLLMSAGDGTAKPQDDDIIRSKTIAKVTSTNVSCTHPDGSYCVPCVLMAC